MGDNVGRKLSFLLFLLLVSFVFSGLTINKVYASQNFEDYRFSPIHRHRNLTLCVLYNNGTFKDAVSWDIIPWGQVDRIGVRTETGITGFEANYGSVIWHPYHNYKLYSQPLFFTFQRFWAYVGGEWHRNYITTNVSKTPFLYQRNETFDYNTYTLNNYTWGMGWWGAIDYSGYNFNVSVALEANQLFPISKLKTNVTTPLDLEDHALEYQLYLNPYWVDYAEKNVEWLRVHFLNGSHRDYNISNVMDVTHEISNMAWSFTFLTSNLTEVNTFDFSDVFNMGYESFGSIEEATLPNGVTTYVVKIGTKLGALASGETMVIDPSYEDFTTYVEVDPGTYLDVGENRCNFTDVDRGIVCYLNNFKGTDHFTNFTHQFEVEFTKAESIGYVKVWGVSDNNDTLDNDGDLSLGCNPVTANVPRCFVRDWGNVVGDLMNLALNTHYYVTIEREGSNLNATVRTGSHEGSYVDHSDITTANTNAKDYIYAFSSRSGTPNAAEISGWVENLDLMEAQDVSYPLFENVAVFASLSTSKENLFSLTQLFKMFSSVSITRELEISISQPLNVFASLQTTRELSLILSGLFAVYAHLNTTREIYVKLTEAVRGGVVKVVASIGASFEVAVEYATKGFVLAVGFIAVFIGLIGGAIFMLRRE